MSKLIIKIDDEQLKDEKLREGLSDFLSNEDAFRILKAIMHLMQSGDLGFWLSNRLTRKLRAFAVERRAGRGQSLDDTLFLSWLEQGGNLELNIRWEVETLSPNCGIYRILLEGGKEN